MRHVGIVSTLNLAYVIFCPRLYASQAGNRELRYIVQPAIDCILGESRQISSPAKVLLDEVLRQLFQSSHSRLYEAADESQQAEAPDDELQAASQGDAEPAEADADPEPENQTGENEGGGDGGEYEQPEI